MLIREFKNSTQFSNIIKACVVGIT